MKFQNDEPTLNDVLGRAGIVKEISEAAAHCDPPQVFGVHGDWGLGKTSLMHQVSLYLTGDCPQQSEVEIQSARDAKMPSGLHQSEVTAVWFEAWRYQEEAVPVVALLQEIRSQLAWHATVMRQAKKISEVTLRSALVALEDITKKIGIQASKIQEAGEKWEKDNLASSLPSHTIREHLTKVINDLLGVRKGQPNRRLVVLIDDLDRCESEAAYRLLEGLKIYMTLPNCVFIIGMNQKIIEDAIGKKLADDKNPGMRVSRASSYLEKLCQNIWRLPLVGEPGPLMQKYLPAPMVLSRVETAIQAVHSALSPALVSSGGTIECLPRNPRRLKGFANLVQRLGQTLLKHVPDAAAANANEHALMMLVVAHVYQFHSDLFVRWEASPHLYDLLVRWVRGERLTPSTVTATTGSAGTPARTGEPLNTAGVERPRFPFLERLKLPYAISTNASGTTPGQSWRIEPEFPDPTDPDVFWAQILVHYLADRDLVKSESFVPYLKWVKV